MDGISPCTSGLAITGLKPKQSSTLPISAMTSDGCCWLTPSKGKKCWWGLWGVSPIKSHSLFHFTEVSYSFLSAFSSPNTQLGTNLSSCCGGKTLFGFKFPNGWTTIWISLLASAAHRKKNDFFSGGFGRRNWVTWSSPFFFLFLGWQPTHWQDSSSVSPWGKLQVQVQLGKLVSSKQAWVGKFIS